MNRKGHLVQMNVSLLLLAFLCVFALVLPTLATNPSPEPNIDSHAEFIAHGDLWYFQPNSFRKAALNIENQYQQPKLITGIQMTFNLSDIPNYEANVVVQRGFISEGGSAKAEYQIADFQAGVQKTQQFLFGGDEFLIVDSDYNIQLKPTSRDHMQLQCIESDDELSYYWDPDTMDWAQEGGELSLSNKEWALSALAEPTVPLGQDVTAQSSFVPPDAIDAFYADLTMDRTYVFFLENSELVDFELSIYEYRDQLNNPGMIKEDTKMVSSTGSGGVETATITPLYTGRYYVVVRPKIGNGPYSIRFVENEDPEAIAPEVLAENLELGESVNIKFEDEDSYDPDDDENGNEKIDGAEENNLAYYWDVDSTVDKNSNGIFTDDKDVVGNGNSYTFTKGGEYTVTLTVMDPYGATDVDSFPLYVNYIPVVKASIIYENDGTFAFTGDDITFNADGTYDPDDDTNGNGIIDGGETDHLSYSWDFYDTIDRNMDGNYTNDTDINNKNWKLSYKDPGDYTICLTVKDNPDSGFQASNFTCKEVSVIDGFDPSLYFYGIDEGLDGEIEWEDGKDDIALKETVASKNPTYKFGADLAVDIQRIYCKANETDLTFGLITLGGVVLEEPASSKDDVYYTFYIVERPFTEPSISETNFGDTIITDYIMKFTFHHGVLSWDYPGDETATFSLNYTIIEDGEGLEIYLPSHELICLEDEIDIEDDEELEIFAVSSRLVLTTEQAQTVTRYYRDSAGEKPSGYPSAWAPSTDDDTDDDDTSVQNGEEPTGFSTVTILLIVMGCVTLFIIVLVVILTIVKKKKGRENYREYKIASPGSGTPAGFTIGDAPAPNQQTYPESAQQQSNQQQSYEQLYGQQQQQPQQQSYEQLYGQQQQQPQQNYNGQQQYYR